MRCYFDQVLARSYRDFHVKGFDYICLKFSTEETLKLYTFAEDVANGLEVVAPHDHRYDFTTTVLAGRLHNKVFVPHASGEKFNRFVYRTPLNGGNGFEWAGETRLRFWEEDVCERGQQCSMLAEQLHTIEVTTGTILLLNQEEDRRIESTSTFTRANHMPSLDGLYNRFTVNTLMDRVYDICEAIGADLREYEDGFEIDHCIGNKEIL